ncbi:MAG: nucleotidyltransferase family protein, partial [Clostridia bacterium]|nr:nucleotidyltransferase family protein [Clostridia bacterium]
MQIAIIAEYNPLHNGHAYQIEKVRRTFGEDACITVILGGIFAQRGEPYIAPPYIRAEAAIHAGADLVVELPFPFSSAPASIFARAGVEIAEKIGASVLAFGSECGDLAMLETALTRLDSDEMQAALAAAKEDKANAALSKTRLYPILYKQLYGEEPLDMPNDILAIEYLRAIERTGARLTPYTLRRVGDYQSGAGGFASATALRKGY